MYVLVDLNTLAPFPCPCSLLLKGGLDVAWLFKVVELSRWRWATSCVSTHTPSQARSSCWSLPMPRPWRSSHVSYATMLALTPLTSSTNSARNTRKVSMQSWSVVETAEGNIPHCKKKVLALRELLTSCGFVGIHLAEKQWRDVQKFVSVWEILGIVKSFHPTGIYEMPLLQ